MILHKYFLKCLAHGSYLFADDESREAAVVDPQRDVDHYIRILETEGLKLKYVLETHVHADFVSGYRELAERTGAETVYGAQSGVMVKHKVVNEGDVLLLGTNIGITVLQTPGHTPESVCYVVKDKRAPEEPAVLFSGDTLFVGEVGRPDLLGARMSAAELASMLYDSLQNKIKTLPPDTRVYPAHGAGSACGRNIGSAEFTTIGEELRSNYALQPMSRDKFIELVTTDLPDAPKYFSEDVLLNRAGAKSLEEVVDGMRPFAPGEIKDAMQQGSLLIDTRSAEAFAEATIPGAVYIGLDGQFAGWVGTLVPKGEPLLFLCDEGREEEAAIRCARIGYDSVAGYLKGGIEAWKQAGFPITTLRRLEPSQVPSLIREGERNLVLDVRRPGERSRSRIPGTDFISLNNLEKESIRLPKDKTIAVHCASGYRSLIAVSLLRRLGLTDVSDVRGGMNAYAEAGLAIDDKER